MRKYFDALTLANKDDMNKTSNTLAILEKFMERKNELALPENRRTDYWKRVKNMFDYWRLCDDQVGDDDLFVNNEDLRVFFQEDSDKNDTDASWWISQLDGWGNQDAQISLDEMYKYFDWVIESHGEQVGEETLKKLVFFSNDEFT